LKQVGWSPQGDHQTKETPKTIMTESPQATNAPCSARTGIKGGRGAAHASVAPRTGKATGRELWRAGRLGARRFLDVGPLCTGGSTGSRLSTGPGLLDGLRRQNPAMYYFLNHQPNQPTKPTKPTTLIDYIKLSNQDTLLSQSLTKPLPNGLYFERLPVKLEINNLPESIQLSKVRDTLQSVIQHNPRAQIIALKDGKVHAKTKKRTISLRVNGEAFYHFIIQMNGIVPLMDGRLRTNLYFRINCRPWQCGDCHTIGYHLTCPGKLCANCGANDHQARTCSKRTRYCKNCSKPGHRAKDNHCPKFLIEVAKEIRKHDFPIEVLTDSEMIGALIKQIQLN